MDVITNLEELHNEIGSDWTLDLLKRDIIKFSNEDSSQAFDTIFENAIYSDNVELVKVLDQYRDTKTYDFSECMFFNNDVLCVNLECFRYFADNFMNCLYSNDDHLESILKNKVFLNFANCYIDNCPLTDEVLHVYLKAFINIIFGKLDLKTYNSAKKQVKKINDIDIMLTERNVDWIENESKIRNNVVQKQINNIIDECYNVNFLKRLVAESNRYCFIDRDKVNEKIRFLIGCTMNKRKISAI